MMKSKCLFPRWTVPALISFLLVGSGLSAPASGAESSMDTVRTEAERGGYKLITTDELAALYAEGGKDLVVIDTRQGWEYRAGHIAGAVHFPMEPTWWDRLKSRRTLGKAIGPEKEKLLVFY